VKTLVRWNRILCQYQSREVSKGGRAEVETRISVCSFILQWLSLKFFKYRLLSREDNIFIVMRKHLEIDWCL